MNDFFQRSLYQLKSHNQNCPGHHQSGYVLDASVAKRVLQIRLLPGHVEADKGNDGRTCIGKIVEGICRNGNRIADKSGKKFTSKQQKIKTNPHCSAKDTVSLADLGGRRIVIIRYLSFC